MMHLIILATRWRRDGTPYPPRKFLLCLEQGDPLAIAVLCVVVAFIVFKIHKFFHEA
jgi:hypothetical protein